MSEQERVHFKIALPVGLKQQLEQIASTRRRSLSAEIIARLEGSLANAVPVDPREDPIAANMNMVSKTLHTQVEVCSKLVDIVAELLAHNSNLPPKTSRALDRLIEDLRDEMI